jgi:predicted DNA-binding transcriptional regulator AlpA
VRETENQHSKYESEPAPAPRRYLTGPTVCERYGVTDMSLWRWLQDTELGFPKPAMVINRRRFWLENDLLAWERSRARVSEVEHEALAGAATANEPRFRDRRARRRAAAGASRAARASAAA